MEKQLVLFAGLSQRCEAAETLRLAAKRQLLHIQLTQLLLCFCTLGTFISFCLQWVLLLQFWTIFKRSLLKSPADFV